MNKAGLPAKGSIQGIHFQPHTGPSSCPLSQPLDFRPCIWSEIPLGSSSLLSTLLVLICLFIFAMWSFSFLFWAQLSQQITAGSHLLSTNSTCAKLFPITLTSDCLPESRVLDVSTHSAFRRGKQKCQKINVPRCTSQPMRDGDFVDKYLSFLSPQLG